jgi:hypothetical protein
MGDARKKTPGGNGEVVDFDEALLDACPAEERQALMTEANMLAKAFAPHPCVRELETLARKLQSEAAELEAGRAHAHRLAAALRRIARTKP